MQACSTLCNNIVDAKNLTKNKEEEKFASVIFSTSSTIEELVLSELKMLDEKFSKSSLAAFEEDLRMVDESKKRRLYHSEILEGCIFDPSKDIIFLLLARVYELLRRYAADSKISSLSFRLSIEVLMEAVKELIDSKIKSGEIKKPENLKKLKTEEIEEIYSGLEKEAAFMKESVAGCDIFYDEKGNFFSKSKDENFYKDEKTNKEDELNSNMVLEGFVKKYANLKRIKGAPNSKLKKTFEKALMSGFLFYKNEKKEIVVIHNDKTTVNFKTSSLKEVLEKIKEKMYEEGLWK